MIADLTDRLAQDWVLRVARDPAIEDDCRRWRALDARHEAAWTAAQDAWLLAGETPTALGAGWREEAAGLEAAVREGTRQGTRRRRRVLVAGGWGALAASLMAAITLPALMARDDMTLTTGTGEVRLLELADGSRVTVGARSDVAVDFEDGMRRVRLDGGQAFFEVAHDAARPFVVVAGDAEIRVTGTKFDVRRVGDDVRVAVLEGRVEVRRRHWIDVPSRSRPDRVLQQGEQSELAAKGDAFSPQGVASIEPGEWREGRFFYADAPLSEVLADASRYRTAPIVAGSPAVADMRVTISFQANNVDQLMGNLEDILPVAARRRPDGSILLVNR